MLFRKKQQRFEERRAVWKVLRRCVLRATARKPLKLFGIAGKILDYVFAVR